MNAIAGGRVGVSQQDVPIGEVWSAGSLPLCKSEASDVVTLRSIDPVEVRGDVHLEGVAVRTTRWASPMGTSTPTWSVSAQASPPGSELRAAIRQVPTTCDSPDEPVGEVVVSMTRPGGRADG